MQWLIGRRCLLFDSYLEEHNIDTVLGCSDSLALITISVVGGSLEYYSFSSATVKVIFKVQDDVNIPIVCKMTPQYFVTAWLFPYGLKNKPTFTLLGFFFFSFFSSLAIMTHQLFTMLKIYADHILNGFHISIWELGIMHRNRKQILNCLSQSLLKSSVQESSISLLHFSTLS